MKTKTELRADGWRKRNDQRTEQSLTGRETEGGEVSRKPKKQVEYIEMVNRLGVVIKIPKTFRLVDLVKMGVCRIGLVSKDAPPPKTDNEYRSHP